MPVEFVAVIRMLYDGTADLLEEHKLQDAAASTLRYKLKSVFTHHDWPLCLSRTCSKM